MTYLAAFGEVATDDACFQKLMDYFVEATGLVYYRDRSREFAAHVSRRFEKLGITNCGDYLRRLTESDGSDELDRLIESSTIGETHFFRHRELFHALQDRVLPELIEKNKHHRRLRIWSAGCSIGAEAYSVAILLRRHLAERVRGWEITILGTDINRKFLARAAGGQFEPWTLRGIPEPERGEYFTQHDGRWTIKECYREGVSFQYHNLATHPFPSLLHNLVAFDLILCRNVVIYFARPMIRPTIDKFHQCLVDRGWLLTGHAEHSTDWFGSFRTVTAQGAVLYQKAAGAGEPGPAAVTIAIPPKPTLAPPPRDTLVLPCRSPRPNEERRDRPQRAKPAALSLPKSADRFEELRLLADRGQLDQASRLCQELLQSNRLEPAPYFYHALILEQTGEHQAAEQSIRQAIYLDRNYMLAHYYLGLLLQRRGDGPSASRSFGNVVALLSQKRPEEQVPHADGLTVADLKELTTSHLASLEQR